MDGMESGNVNSSLSKEKHSKPRYGRDQTLLYAAEAEFPSSESSESDEYDPGAGWGDSEEDILEAKEIERHSANRKLRISMSRRPKKDAIDTVDVSHSVDEKLSGVVKSDLQQSEGREKMSIPDSLSQQNSDVPC